MIDDILRIFGIPWLIILKVKYHKEGTHYNFYFLPASNNSEALHTPYHIRIYVIIKKKWVINAW